MLTQVLMLLALQGLPAGTANTDVGAVHTSQSRTSVPLIDALDARVMSMPGYYSAHPELHFRSLALKARSEGREEEARRYFLGAARYSDKLSQAALAEMYWNGEGGAVDRPLAYAWMDLAAERATPWLIALREQYWNALDERQKVQALQVGEHVYAEYADQVAKPRLHRVLRTARKSVTGSRLGWIGNGLDIYDTNSLSDVVVGRAMASVSADDYYSDRYWDPKVYDAWQNHILEMAPRMGTVEIGPLQPARKD